MSTVIEALDRFRQSCPHIGFDNTGQVGTRKYGYATLPAILDIVTPLLRAQNLVLVQRVTEAGVETTLYQSDGDGYLSSLVPIQSAGLNPQELGSAITYARRYGAVTLLGLAPDEDDDGAAASGRPKPQHPVAVVGEPESEEEPVVEEGWQSASESAQAHSALSDRVTKLDDEQRAICRKFRLVNTSWPLPKEKFDELSTLVTLMEGGVTPEDIEKGVTVDVHPPKEDKF